MVKRLFRDHHKFIPNMVKIIIKLFDYKIKGCRGFWLKDEFGTSTTSYFELPNLFEDANLHTIKQ